MKLDELFRRDVGDKPGDEERIAAIRAKAAAHDQQRQAGLAARASRVISPEQRTQVQKQTREAIPRRELSPEQDFELFQQAANRIIGKPGGETILTKKYSQLKDSDNPMDVKKRQYLHQLIIGGGAHRRGVSVGYR